MSERTIESLSYAIRGPVLLKYFGQLCIVAAVLTSVSLMVSLLYGEFAISLRYAIIIALFLGCGFFFGRREVPKGIQTNEALVLTALVFIVTPLMFTYALMASGLHFVDAFFEAVSGITTTGLSTLATVEDKPMSFLFTRAWLQWSGGLGIVVLTVALLLGPGLAAKRLVDFVESEDIVGWLRKAAADSRQTSACTAARASSLFARLAACGLLLTPFS